MRQVSFYHKETGVLNGVQLIVSNHAAVALNTPPDHIAIDGCHDAQSYRVDVATGELIDWQPPQPSSDHEWNAKARRWRLNAAAEAREGARRSALAQIAMLEASQHRAIREAALGKTGAGARLQAIDDQIAKLRQQLS